MRTAIADRGVCEGKSRYTESSKGVGDARSTSDCVTEAPFALSFLPDEFEDLKLDFCGHDAYSVCVTHN